MVLQPHTLAQLLTLALPHTLALHLVHINLPLAVTLARIHQVLTHLARINQVLTHLALALALAQQLRTLIHDLPRQHTIHLPMLRQQ